MVLVGSTRKALYNSTSVDVDVAFYDVVVSLMCCHCSSMASNKLLSTSATMFAIVFASATIFAISTTCGIINNSNNECNHEDKRTNTNMNTNVR